MLARFSPNLKHARKPGRLRPVIVLVVVVAIFAAFPFTFAAQESPGVIVTGKGFIDDQPVADGTVVEAWIRGIPVAATKVFESEYQLYLTEPPGESFDGDVVRFKLGGYGTDAAAGWFEGTESWILLYAYTGRQGYPNGFEGDVTADPEPLDMNAIRELRATLSQLIQERSELAEELEHQAEIEIATITNRWEGAIAELRAEVERRIQQVKRKFELERQQITFGPRRDAILSRLDAEVDEFIDSVWVEFEFEAQLKQSYLNEEILEIELSKDFELNNLNQLIYQVESDIKTRLGKVGISFHDFRDRVGDERSEPAPVPINQFRDTVGDERPARVRVPGTNGSLDRERADSSPNPSGPKETERNRGFFTNSISTETDALGNALDPTMLAVFGILITLAATMVQLVKGN